MGNKFIDGVFATVGTICLLIIVIMVCLIVYDTPARKLERELKYEVYEVEVSGPPQVQKWDKLVDSNGPTLEFTSRPLSDGSLFDNLRILEISNNRLNLETENVPRLECKVVHLQFNEKSIPYSHSFRISIVGDNAILIDNYNYDIAGKLIYVNPEFITSIRTKLQVLHCNKQEEK